MQNRIRMFLRGHIASFSKYVLVGGSAALVDFLTFLLLLNTHQIWAQWFSFENEALQNNITVANTVAMMTGFIWSFILQRNWAFKSTRSASLQLIMTTLLLALNIHIVNLAIPLLTQSLLIPPSWAKLVMQVFVVIWNYLIYRYLIFRVLENNNE